MPPFVASVNQSTRPDGHRPGRRKVKLLNPKPCSRRIAPGGVLLLHGYAPRQVDYGTGGPPNASHMYTVGMLRDAFDSFEILRLTDYDAKIDEGPGHSGKSALVDLIARKPI